MNAWKKVDNSSSKSVTPSKTQEAPAKSPTNNAVPSEPTSTSTSMSNTPVVSGSSYDSSNIQKKEIAQAVVTNGENTTVNFTNNTTCVESITFTSDEMISKILVIVEELKNKLDSSPYLPEGEIYKFFNISIGTDNLNSIRNASINFSVNNSWIQENNINQSLIALNEYNNTSEEWEKMPVNISGHDSQALHITADVPGYSYFAIIANESNTTNVPGYSYFAITANESNTTNVAVTA